MENRTHCTKCGTKLKIKEIPIPWYMKFFLGAKDYNFDGCRIMAEEYSCPNEKMFQFHTNFTICDRP